ncbi:MAG: S8/S53 family peptidase [Pseudomonadales bacterium]|nr:S8/S53 family peptidase [Pseudomonadales bacterium]
MRVLLAVFFTGISTLILLGVVGCNGSSGSGAGSADRSTANQALEDSKILFNWDDQSDETICSGLRFQKTLALGAAFDAGANNKNRRALDKLQDYLETHYSDALNVIDREERLSILDVELNDCNVLSALRASPLIEYVEPKYQFPKMDTAIETGIAQLQARALSRSSPASVDDDINPGFYDPNSFRMPYKDYIRETDEKAADIIEHHGLDKIYQQYEFFGNSNIGVAVLDNGVFPEWESFFSQGNGSYSAEGFYRYYITDTAPDGTQPRAYDFYGITQTLDDLFIHGTRQTELVYTMAPHINFRTVRASSFIVWLLPSQFQGVTNAIMALAEDPTIRIISSSMGTVTYSHEVARAIEYFVAQDKIFVSAAGTSAPVLKEFVRVVFPASLPFTLSLTGIRDTDETDGKYELGELAHGGLGVDFVIDHSISSSESASPFSGMLALLWSANPNLTRTELEQILIESSSEYQSRGKKDPVFGWGKVDMYQAFLNVRDTAK